MKEFKYTIKDELGIHARPAGLLVKEAATFPCKVTIEKGGKEVKTPNKPPYTCCMTACAKNAGTRIRGRNHAERFKA